ncbi:MAG: prepilin peptidase, partial [Eubacterium sp.]|nr:prepilin peptidase [Eubacterium sp.]
ITIPDRLKNVDKVTIIQCTFDFLFLMILILIGWIDYKKQIIPNILNGLILVLGVLMQICGMMLSETISFPEHIIGLFILSAPLILLGIFYNGSFGMGDVKLLASTGFFMGWKNLVMGTFLGSFIAAMICIISLIQHKMGLKDKIAFGPYLCMGMAIVRLINWFMI